MFDRKNIFSVLLAVFFIVGCGGSSGDTESFIDQNSELATTVIENYVDDVVIETYYDLRQKATALREAVEDLEAGTGTVEAAADAWTASRIPWERGICAVTIFGVEIYGTRAAAVRIPAIPKPYCPIQTERDADFPKNHPSRPAAHAAISSGLTSV